MKNTLTICLSLMFTLLPSMALAQEGSIRGRVVDNQSGKLLAGAVVSIMDLNQFTATNGDGMFSFAAIPEGTYSLRASAEGYLSVIRPVRVDSNLSTEVNFALSPNPNFAPPRDSISAGEKEVEFKRPLIEKTSTGTVLTVSREFFSTSPVRGIDAAIALQPGVVQKGGDFHIRGGRPDEVGYLMEGVPVTDLYSGGRMLTITDAALDHIDILMGGYGARYGGGNAGIVRAELRTGGDAWKFSLQAETDNYTSRNTRSFGGYSYGYSDMVATAGGPVLQQNLRVFGSFQRTHYTDPAVRVWDGFDFSNVKTFPNRTPAHPTISRSDTIDLVAAPGNTYGGKDNRTTLTGSLVYDLGDFKLRASGSYSGDRAQTPTTISNIFNTRRLPIVETDDGFMSIKASAALDASTSLEANVYYSFSKYRTMDPDLRYDVRSYFDSAANARKGYVLRSDGWSFDPIRITLGNNSIGELPSFNQYGTPVSGFLKRNQSSLGGRVDIDSRVGQGVSIEAGGELSSHTFRQYNPLGLSQWPYNFKTYSGDELERMLRQNGARNFGFDIFGHEIKSDVIRGNALTTLGPRHPFFGSAYAQTTLQGSDAILKLGLRFEYFSSDAVDVFRWRDGGFRYNDSLSAFTAQSFSASPPHQYVSPSVGFSVGIDEHTSLFGQYSRHMQQPRMYESYVAAEYSSYTYHAEAFPGFTLPNGLRPTRTYLYEVGLRREILQKASLDISAFYKDIIDQVQYMRGMWGEFQTAWVSTNADFATSKGIEFRFTLHRSNRIQAFVQYAFTHVEGTASDPLSDLGAWGAPSSFGTYLPKMTFPLTFDRTHQGMASLDYRFEDGNSGPILDGMGINLLIQFHSGDHFTRIQVSSPTIVGDARFRVPVEPVGSSVGPSFFQLDARLDKSFQIDQLNFNVYLYVINLLGTRNVVSVFSTSGDPADDGWLGSQEGKSRMKDFGADAELYAQMYRAFYGGANSGNYGPPRQIRFGVRVEY